MPTHRIAMPTNNHPILAPVEPERVSGAPLYRLLAWLSPGFPVGAFSYSQGLETAAESGAVHDRTSLQNWISAVLTLGSGRVDADMLLEAHQAAVADDVDGLVDANRRGLAFRATAEMALETAAQGAAFLDICRAAWPDPFLARWAARLDDGAACYAIAVGAAMARAGIPAACALAGYLQAMSANLVSAGLRLGIIGQSDGQRIVAALEPVIGAAAAAASGRPRDRFGTATFAVEVASMTHETQYTRLFRS
jgi:urease accessory protein